MYTGSCLCGAISFQIKGTLAPIQICHCQQCRKVQGAPFAANIPVRAENFQLLKGAASLREYASAPGKARVFCSQCGSPIISKRDADPGTVRVRAGSINEALPVRPASHAYVASKANWWEICDDLPQFPAARPPADG